MQKHKDVGYSIYLLLEIRSKTLIHKTENNRCSNAEFRVTKFKTKLLNYYHLKNDKISPKKKVFSDVLICIEL